MTDRSYTLILLTLLTLLTPSTPSTPTHPTYTLPIFNIYIYILKIGRV